MLRDRFRDILVEKEAYLRELCRYLPLKPERVRPVRAARDRSWSSNRAPSAWRAHGGSSTEIGRAFGLHVSTISRIAAGPANADANRKT